ncbi:SDR family NAD(P)-dependent oxidoreductase [Conexibacter sp. CPCC 206217]|uniref:SDR family NAD(P)-dependent oxidoreductase n=1 Tax=Conexibacter sp. CPCC 206217 TaxID=3064574 RepID=UPI002725E25B|nr:SDR family NAD(P)-dependent oxidoreductase [Conexibacter sp. CPCC 206217]MDO8212589.1 SDR family NAD(P)-dependent oxidoreductase [Conexibacter sp. CPCC 206217]
MDLGLEGRVAIVTGASRGLGRAAAVALAAEGAHVLGVARTTGDLASLAASDPQRIAVAACDMRDTAQVAALPAQAIERFGRVDVVVNNAGIAPAASFAEQDWQVWNEVLAVNVTAPAVLAQAAGRHFIAQRSGKVINIASTSGVRGKPSLVAYSTSKGALVRFTEALSGEWARHGIQVNTIAPGAFDTVAQAAVTGSPEVLEKRVRKIPARRMGEVGEFGPLVAFLASPLAEFITGATYVIDGGEVAKL